MHIPVMLDECLAGLFTDPAGVYVDGTLGNGGHAAAIAEKLTEEGRLIGFDRDAEAIARVAEKLKAVADRVVLIHDNYANMASKLDEIGVDKVSGILLDLGVSSNQIDTADRGFSFMHDGPIDMRMDQTGDGQTAADLVNNMSETELADIIYRYGEERAARKIAKAIVEAREEGDIETTASLAGIVEKAKGGRRGKRIHPATKTFQALRMAVNDELASLEKVLEDMIERVEHGGRIVILTFHSLEDRIVKQFFNRHVPKEESLQQGGVRRVYDEPPAKWIWKKPLVASEEEQKENPRSRSAKLRAIAVGE